MKNGFITIIRNEIKIDRNGFTTRNRMKENRCNLLGKLFAVFVEIKNIFSHELFETEVSVRQKSSK